MPVNVDPNEIKKFAAMSANWWDETGELRTLHEINPLRMRFITERVAIAGKKIADIGCGGGILSEALARAGANVTGIDMNEAAIQVAKLHLLESGLTVNYECLTAEALAEREPQQFDVITCLEMLEHVPDPSAIVKACAALLKPGGMVFFSTLNRTPKSYLFAIVGAEYILRLLPKNTHDYAKFIRPSELSAWCTQHDLTPNEIQGIAYNPFTKHFKITTDVNVNYLLCASKS
jgi:2-polyprenyl-6-hydroxyphenyl methylase/3-demethylubiquinone-9 3-methyltransferase